MISDRKGHEAFDIPKRSTFPSNQTGKQFCFIRVNQSIATQTIITKDSIDCSNRNIQSQSINNGIVRDEMACF